MPTLGSILSIKNTLYFTGVVSVVVGSPMIVAPALAVRFFLGKRSEAREADKKALNVIMRANGISIFASGLKSLLAKPTIYSLSAAATMEGMYSLYHTCNRLCKEWKDAEGDMNANNLFIPAAWLVFLVDVVSLCCGDREEDEEEEKAD